MRTPPPFDPANPPCPLSVIVFPARSTVPPILLLLAPSEMATPLKPLEAIRLLCTMLFVACGPSIMHTIKNISLDNVAAGRNCYPDQIVCGSLDHHSRIIWDDTRSRGIGSD